MGVLLFRKLLNFPKNALAKLRDQRRSRRYPIGPDFPLKATLTLLGPSGEPGTSARWTGRLADFSSTGASVIMPLAASAKRGHDTTLELRLDHLELRLPCRIAHFRSMDDHCRCGVALEKTDAAAQKAYLQLLESVVIGATFAPTKAKGLPKDPAGLVRQDYRSDHREARLHVWRDKKTKILDAFELVIDWHCLRGAAKAAVPGRTRIQIFSRHGERGADHPWSDPSLGLMRGEHQEFRQLYGYITANLPPGLPADLRELMRKFC
ncbi:MAG: hypothetical protein C0502_04460 [Opitutus sp.]|nr:hypothetical protein [Opitutus sp.]